MKTFSVKEHILWKYVRAQYQILYWIDIDWFYYAIVYVHIFGMPDTYATNIVLFFFFFKRLLTFNSFIFSIDKISHACHWPHTAHAQVRAVCYKTWCQFHNNCIRYNMSSLWQNKEKEEDRFFTWLRIYIKEIQFIFYPKFVHLY